LIPFSMPTFIETQFPIARLSAESYKERKAGASQTLTGLGKWWGRKPLILVRASILGMLMPASDNHQKDREIFLKILTMDDDGAWQRCKGEIPAAAWREAAPPEIQEEYFGARGFKQGMDDEVKEEVCAQIWESLSAQRRQALDTWRRRPINDRSTFDSLPYAKRLKHCERPENIEGPTAAAWAEINAHLSTGAKSLPELVEQLGQRTFGHTPRVGDAFCGGGSIPFEAARIGCEAFGSDLNPVAGLLTWASLNLLGGGDEVQEEIRRVQEAVFAAADRQITDWGIEHNERGERAEAYVYCVEVKPDGCDYYIPLAPSWLVDEYCKVVVRWDRTLGADHLTPQILLVPQGEIVAWRGNSKNKILPKGATVGDSRVIDPFDASRSWSVEALRGPEGLRRWSNDDVVPRPGDVFQERLYCIRWVKNVTDPDGTVREIRRYDAPDEADLAREAKVLKLLQERFSAWQREGFIPSKAIVSGYNTDQPTRERGWTHWHHLFTPRQLLVHGLLANLSSSVQDRRLSVVTMLNMGRLADWDSRLSCWLSHKTQMSRGKNTFLNQALNTLFNYSNRPLLALAHAQISSANQFFDCTRGEVKASDARDLRETCDFWITDPPYADAVNYHELGDFFLAWYDKQLAKVFPEWIPDARAELAVRGDGKDFRRSMVEIYHNLARHMPDNGLQMVMFTHQDPAVWADLGMILWAAGLKATAAWTISTETEAVGIKKGNYVQGTVCLVLRKRTANEPGFLDEVYPLVEDEVKRQIASMQALDEDGEPNFNDADYQLAAYAAALKVLTQYGTLDGKDVEHEVFAVRDRNTKSDFQIVIERALGIACDFLVPRGLDASWRDVSLVERYYLRALDIESRGERRKGMYEELARGFGVTDIRPLLKSDKANGARMHTPSGFAAAGLAPLSGDNAGNSVALPARRGRAAAGAAHPFAPSPLRHLLFAIRETTAADNSPEPGRQYLRDSFGQGYWGQRERFITLLEWLAALGNAEGMSEWITDSEAARILAGRLRNDQA
jgi:adenine-specific DNA methylase